MPRGAGAAGRGSEGGPGDAACQQRSCRARKANFIGASSALPAFYNAAVDKVDVAIRGQGPVGMALALALSRLGLSIGIVPAEPVAVETQKADIRAYALNAAARGLLADLKVWDALAADAVTPVEVMRIEGDRRERSRLDFSAWQQGTEALAWIVDAAELDAALRAALRFAPHVRWLVGGFCADLTALAEGKDSASRKALGVSFERSAYDQIAVAARLTASVAHAHTARQWFRSPDVLALLPLDRPVPGRSYALVWSLPSARAREQLAADVDAFEAALNAASAGAAGTLSLAGARAGWPLALARADRICGPGWVVLGDAAHVVHPLAGQGLNLGFGDVAALARVLAAREPWRALGDEALLRRYARQRALPIQAMAAVTDGLLHLFAADHPVLEELRNRGLSLLNHLSPLKRALTARALDA